MDAIYYGYERLYEECGGADGFGGMSHFVAVRGRYYDYGTTRPLVVGRAPVRWPPFPAARTSSARSFAVEAEMRFADGGRTFGSFLCGQGYTEEMERVVHVCTRDGLVCRRGDADCHEPLDSPLWRRTRALLPFFRGLPGRPGTEVTRAEGEDVGGPLPMEDLAWTNLYKVAPAGGGEPSPELRKTQFGACAELLAAELLGLRPTIVVLMTGYGWAEPFLHALSATHSVSISTYGDERPVQADGDRPDGDAERESDGRSDDESDQGARIEADGCIGSVPFFVTDCPVGGRGDWSGEDDNHDDGTRLRAEVARHYRDLDDRFAFGIWL